MKLLNLSIILICLGIGLLITTLYIPSLHSYFVSDDFYLWKAVKDIPLLNSWRLFLPSRFGGVDIVKYTGHQAPLSAWLVWFNTVPLKMLPFAAHLVSLLLHLIVVSMTGLFAYLFTKNIKIAMLSSLFAGTFSYTSQTVYFMSAVLFQLGTLFYLLTLILLLLYLKTKSKVWYIFHLLSFYLALISAEISLTLPIALFVLFIAYKKTSLITAFQGYIRFFKVYIFFISVYVFLWMLSLESSNIFSMGGRFEQIVVSKLFLYYLLATTVLGILRIWLRPLIPLQIIEGERMFWIFILLVGISWLPTARILTEQRYLYLPSVFAAIALALAFVNIYKSTKIKTYKLILIMICFFVLIGQSILLFRSSLTWLQASQTAHSILIQLSENLKNYSLPDELYLINIPDSIDGAYVHRSYFTQSYEFATGNRLPKVIFTPMTIGTDTTIRVTSPNFLQLSSRNGFVLFKPEYDAIGQRVIEWPNVYKAVETDPQTLEVQFLESDFDLQQKIVFGFENGEIKPILE